MTVYIGFFLAKTPDNYHYSDNVVFLKLENTIDFFQYSIYILENLYFTQKFDTFNNNINFIQLFAHIIFNTTILRESKEDGRSTLTIEKPTMEYDDSWQDAIDYIYDILDANNYRFAAPDKIREDDHIYLVYTPAYTAMETDTTEDFS